MNTTPLVSVIIVNFNGKKLLKNCLESLMKVTYKKFEVILVDNNSTDDSVEFVKNHYPSVMIIKLDKNYGFVEPNNIGAKNAKGDFLLFLNNDTIVKSDFLTELVIAANQDSKIAILQSLLLKPNGEIDSSGDFIDKYGVAFSSKEKVENTREILSARGAAMMIKNEVFKKLGGFDEKFFASYEDVDLGWRAWILGFKVVVLPKSIVYHIGGQTVQKVDEVVFHSYKNQLSMIFTNFESWLAIKNLILFVATYGTRMIRIILDYKLKGSTNIKLVNQGHKLPEKPSLKMMGKSLLWTLTNPRYLLKKHKLVNSSRVLNTRDLEKMKIILQ